MSQASQAMFGLAILGDSLHSPTHWPQILSGEYDEALLAAFHLTPGGINAAEALTRLKNMIRASCQRIFTAAAEEDQKQLLTELKQRNAVHKFGTVAEIAAKYNISKSEVRRRKADGTLEEFVTLLALKGPQPLQ